MGCNASSHASDHDGLVYGLMRGLRYHHCTPTRHSTGDSTGGRGGRDVRRTRPSEGGGVPPLPPSHRPRPREHRRRVVSGCIGGDGGGDDGSGGCRSDECVDGDGAIEVVIAAAAARATCVDSSMLDATVDDDDTDDDDVVDVGDVCIANPIDARASYDDDGERMRRGGGEFMEALRRSLNLDLPHPPPHASSSSSSPPNGNPPSQCYLGSTYWIAVDECDDDDNYFDDECEHRHNGHDGMWGGIGDDDGANEADGGAALETTMPTSCSAAADDDDDDRDDDDGMPFSPRTSVDLSRELLDYSHLSESFVLGEAARRSHQHPRRLFDEDAGDNADVDADVPLFDESMSSFLAEESSPTRGDVPCESSVAITPRRTPMAPCPSNRADAARCHCHYPPLPRLVKSVLCIATTPSPGTPPQRRCPTSPNVSTFYGRWGSRRERRISTLPSLEIGRPVRLRVSVDRQTGGDRDTSRSPSSTRSNAHPDEYYFTYDPHFSPNPGEYAITTSPGGRPYGNGLVLRMGGYDGRRGRYGRRTGRADEGGGGRGGGLACASQFMLLEDRRGDVPCVIKSHRTHDLPSAVIYSPMPRYVGQVPSGHRLTRRCTSVRDGEEVGGGGERRRRGRDDAVAVIDDDGEDHDGESESLYPWALIRKGGRAMADECAIHLVNDDIKGKTKGSGGMHPRKNTSNNNGGGSGSIFHSEPSFRGRHGFDECGRQTHTVVSRMTISSANDPNPPSTKAEARKNIADASKRRNGDASNGATIDYSSTSLKGVPCCLIIRDPADLDAVDLTIAPGIDPLLMICFLASHSKMDVECIMSGY